MNKLLIIVASLSLCFSACLGGVGSGKVVTEERSIGSFRKVSVGSGLHLEATAGARKLTLTTDDNVMPIVQTFVANDTLFIQLPPSSIPPLATVFTAELSNDVFEGIDASGGCDVRLVATGTAKFPISASGGSDVFVDGLSASEVTMDASGGSTITIAGASQTAEASASGGSELKLRAFPVETMRVDASGGSTVTARVSSSLTGSASGGSTVSVIGTPTNRVDTSGGSRVNVNVE
ncbi:MAG: DUF2807 domain-containing protein [Archangium sp.]|nr:DUF2807 domain-containing protein [Archangium sp.]